MKTGRRYFLANFILMLAAARTLPAQGQRPAPPVRGPQFPGSRGTDASPDDVPLPPAADPEAQLKESQKALRRDADHLLQLAQELKDQAYDTEQTKVLSLSLIHKAEEVEKLAKQIRGLVRAA